MLSRIHSKLGTAGLIVAVVALVAALTGAAFAAGGLTKQQEKQVKKIAKKFAGKPGANGAPGAAGIQGPKGDTGAKGDTGPEGKQGNPGKNGLDGEDGACSEGNPECVLPSGGKETGAWIATSAKFIEMPFNIELSAAPTEVNFVKENGKELFGAGHTEERTPVNCLGTVVSPEPEPGHVCMYAQFETPDFKFNFEESPPPFTFKQGALVNVSGSAGWGTWAVTAP